MAPILGIIASGITASTLANSYESIATATVGSGGAADVTFSSIPSTYTHLQIRGISKSTSATNATDLLIQLNSDTGTNYARHGLYGNRSSAVAYATANNSRMELALSVAASGSTSTFGASVIDILDYANTNKYKTMRGLAGTDANGTTNQCYLGLFSSLWQNTNAITSIKIYLTTGNLAQYSHFALYGIKG
jgi:hypothetical protein